MAKRETKFLLDTFPCAEIDNSCQQAPRSLSHTYKAIIAGNAIIRPAQNWIVLQNGKAVAIRESPEVCRSPTALRLRNPIHGVYRSRPESASIPEQ